MFPLTLKSAAVRRKGRLILGPVDLVIGPSDGPQGALTVIIGPNGAGKTTLLRVMHGVERLSDGSARWSVPDREAQTRQAYVFQAPIMLRRSVAENLAYPLHLTGTPRAEIEAAVHRWGQRIGLGTVMQSRATRLSGGERQKLALARALIRNPDVLFLDEPCANLDGRSVIEIEALLLETRASGTRILLATHDMGQARRLATDAVFMMSGRVHESGPADVLLNTPKTPELNAFLKGDILA
jgi:tungstate transport system ATP-binding protein